MTQCLNTGKCTNELYVQVSNYIRYIEVTKQNDVVIGAITLIVWWQNGDLGLGWVLEYIQRFIVDSDWWDPTDRNPDL